MPQQLQLPPPTLQQPQLSMLQQLQPEVLTAAAAPCPSTAVMRWNKSAAATQSVLDSNVLQSVALQHDQLASSCTANAARVMRAANAGDSSRCCITVTQSLGDSLPRRAERQHEVPPHTHSRHAMSVKTRQSRLERSFGQKMVYMSNQMSDAAAR